MEQIIDQLISMYNEDSFEINESLKDKLYQLECCILRKYGFEYDQGYFGIEDIFQCACCKETFHECHQEGNDELECVVFEGGQFLVEGMRKDSTRVVVCPQCDITYDLSWYFAQSENEYTGKPEIRIPYIDDKCSRREFLTLEDLEIIRQTHDDFEYNR